MDKKIFSERQIKVGGTTGVEPISIVYKNDNYDLELYSNSKASETGHVVIAKLFSKDEKLPSFIFRWDHGSEVVDIDIFLAGKSRKDLWEQSGYGGHWTKLTNDEKQEYSFLIKIPECKIFEGTIRVGLLTELNLHDTINVSESIDIKVM
jgi:hypothetical protein